MRKIGKAFKRSGRSGWWLRWTCPAAGKRITKSFHTKGQAEHFRKILYTQLNSDIIVGTINTPLSTAIAEYLKKYETLGLSDSARTEAAMSLRHLTSLCGETVGSKTISQHHLDQIVHDRKKQVSTWTVNKDIANIKAFIRWGKHRSRRYLCQELEMTKLKTPQIIVTALTDARIRALIRRAPTTAWRIRLLISLTTGLRKKDVDCMRISDVDLDQRDITVIAKKTGKITQCPIADAIFQEVSEYVDKRNGERVFEDKNIQKTWDGFRNGITRQDLRKTFATLIQRIGPISAARDLLGHSHWRTTEKFYTDKMLILRWKINQLPLKKWLDNSAG